MGVKLVGYHGTLLSNAESILASGVRPSRAEDEWLGDGSYFFIDGLRDAKTSAIDWATCAAWNREYQRFTEDKLAIIKTEVTAPINKVFDIREMENAKTFHALRREWLERKYVTRLSDSSRPDDRTFDTELFNEFKTDRGVAIVIGNFHIQLSVRERHFRLDSRIPNVSVMCLSPNDDQAIQTNILGVETVDRARWADEELV